MYYALIAFFLVGNCQASHRGPISHTGRTWGGGGTGGLSATQGGYGGGQGAYQPHREDMEGRTGGLSATQGVYGGGQGAYPPHREDMEGDRGPISHTADMEGD